MLIQRDQTIAGYPAPLAREAVRSLQSGLGIADELGSRLGLDNADAEAMLEALAGELLLEELEPTAGMRRWRPTVAGNALGKARIGKAMPRADAEHLLERVLDTAAEINADPEELYWIDVIDLYGSLTDPERQTVGDVDLHVIASHRDGREAYEARSNAIIESTERSFSTLLDRLAYPENRLRSRLRLNTPRVDVHLDIGHVRPLPEGATVVEVFRRPGCAADDDGATRRGPGGEVLPW